MTAPTPELTPAYLRDLARIVDGDMHDHQMTRLATRNALRAAADEVERLRAVFEIAPHDLTKQHAWHGLNMTLCRCWKSEVMADV